MSAAKLAVRCTAFLGACLFASGCRHSGAFVWVDEYREAAPPADRAYLMGPGDVLSVRVLNHDEMSGKVRVRTDGRISLPFLNDVDVAGQNPVELAEKLRGNFKEFVNNPVVTVTVDEPRPFTISVLGEVVRPGIYPLEPRASVLQALASAGGLSQFAHDDRIYVLRRPDDAAPPKRIRFKYDWLAHAEGRSAIFGLQRDDIVLVE